MLGKVIVLNGTSSSGKSTIAKALQLELPEPFWHLTSDHFVESKKQLHQIVASGKFQWEDIRSNFYNGLHKAVTAFVTTNNNIIFEHIVESEDWVDQIGEMFRGLDVFLVGVDCPIEITQAREVQRGEHLTWITEEHQKTHSYLMYDLVIEGHNKPEDNAKIIVEAWLNRDVNNALQRLSSR